MAGLPKVCDHAKEESLKRALLEAALKFCRPKNRGPGQGSGLRSAFEQFEGAAKCSKPPCQESLEDDRLQTVDFIALLTAMLEMVPFRAHTFSMYDFQTAMVSARLNGLAWGLTAYDVKTPTLSPYAEEPISPYPEVVLTPPSPVGTEVDDQSTEVDEETTTDSRTCPFLLHTPPKGNATDGATST